MDYPKLIVSNQKEESSNQSVKSQTRGFQVGIYVVVGHIDGSTDWHENSSLSPNQVCRGVIKILIQIPLSSRVFEYFNPCSADL